MYQIFILLLPVLLIGCTSNRTVTFTRDVTMPKEFPFVGSNESQDKSLFRGAISSGTVCKENLKKGSISYLQCSIIVPSDALNYEN